MFPLDFLSHSKEQQERLSNIVSLSDFLTCSKKVLGQQLMLILLRDVQRDPRQTARSPNSFIADLRQDCIPSWAKHVGFMTITKLCESLIDLCSYRYPYVFGRAIEIVSGAGHNCVDTLRSGCKSLRLNYFPCFRLWNCQRNRQFSWVGNGVLRLTTDTPYDGEGRLMEYQMAANIINELESRHIVFRSHFNDYINPDGEVYIPWLKPILDRLAAQSWLDQKGTFDVLMFCTCVALFQEGWFVNYTTFRDLENKLPIPQMRLQTLRILACFRLLKTNVSYIYRIHEDIPTQMVKVKETKARETIPRERDADDSEDEEPLPGRCEDATTELPCDVVNIQTAHLPSRILLPWSENEREIMLYVAGQCESRNMYKMYCMKCEEQDIPDRSKNAFYKKLTKIMAAKR